MRSFLLFFFLFLCSMSVVAQKNFKPGYIIQNNDTIRGFINQKGERQNSYTVKFKPVQGAAGIVYSPITIEGYGIDGGLRYEALPVLMPNSSVRKVFLNLLSKGRANLYMYRDSTHKDRFYIMKGKASEELIYSVSNERDEKGVMHKIQNRQYLTVLVNAFYDCEKIRARIAKVQFTQNSLIDIFSQYNSCNDEFTTGKEFTQEKKQWHFNWGVMAGMSKTHLLLSGYNNFDNSEAEFDSPPSVLIGLTSTLSIPWINERFSLQSDLYLVKESYTNHTEVLDRGKLTKTDMRMKATYIKMPIMIRYTFPFKYVKPYLNFGLLNGYALQAEHEMEVESTFYETVNQYPTTPIFKNYRKYNQGWVASAGALVPFFKDHQLQLQGTFENNNGFSDGVFLKTVSKSFHFSLGYIF